MNQNQFIFNQLYFTPLYTLSLLSQFKCALNFFLLFFKIFNFHLILKKKKKRKRKKKVEEHMTEALFGSSLKNVLPKFTFYNVRDLGRMYMFLRENHMAGTKPTHCYK